MKSHPLIHAKLIRVLDITLIATLLLILFPFWIINIITALISRQAIVNRVTYVDAFGVEIKSQEFSCGLFKKTPIVLQIMKGDMSIVGASIIHKLSISDLVTMDDFISIHRPTAGLVSLYDLYQWMGITDKSHLEILSKQVDLTRTVFHYLILVAILNSAYLIYGRRVLKTPKEFSLYGLTINNDSIAEAINWISGDRESRCKKAYFINVNSINLSLKNAVLFNNLLAGDKLFADGSGVRLAAAHLGFHLRANLNGTDLLPHICNALSKSGKSVFFLGAAPGIAESASNNLKKQFPELDIAGCFHGYFNKNESQAVIDMINHSKAHTLLVAFGSPIQENWLSMYSDQLQCANALAVGGLFDFFSGKIPRAPEWMRSIGAEWIWRLWQEPVAKFKRYVLGNPLFIFNTFILNKAGATS